MKQVFFEKGNYVFSIAHGNGFVLKTDKGNGDVTVQFEKKKVQFSSDGRYFMNEMIVLFQVKPVITENVAIFQFKAGELVWVRMFDEYLWHKRFFSHESNGFYYCYDEKKTDRYFELWKEIKKFI